MKEILKSRTMVGFIVVVLSLTIFSCNKTDNKTNLETNNIEYNYQA